MIYKIAIIAYLVLYTGIALGLRSYILFKNTGINPFQKMGKGGAQGFNEKILMLGASLVPVIALLYLLSPQLYTYLLPIQFLELLWLKNIGVLFILFGSLLAIIAQFQMGDSWRIGINHQEKTALVTNSLYQYSRNPIYLGLLTSFLGFFLIVPNVLSLCCLLFSYPSVEIKIRMEEQYLIEKHGKAFQDYMEKVRRWI